MQFSLTRQAPIKGRVGLMLGAALLFHGGIVGIGALLVQPQPDEHTVGPDGWFLPPGEEGPTPIYPVPNPESSQTTDATTPTPPEIDSMVPTPPAPSEQADMEEPSKPAPTPRKPTTTARAAGPPTAPRTSSIQPGSSGPSVANAGPAKAVGAWVMPHPPYPHTISAFRPTGSTVVRITTDASGRVSNVVITKSAGNPILDHQTESFVRMNWHGPPNAARTTEFVYQVR